MHHKCHMQDKRRLVLCTRYSTEEVRTDRDSNAQQQHHLFNHLCILLGLGRQSLLCPFDAVLAPLSFFASPSQLT